MNKMLNLIKTRRSIRAYSPEPVAQSDLDAILEAAVFAPSAHNGQPWHFTVIRNREIIDGLNVKTKEAMSRQKDKWTSAAGKNPNFHVFYHAPVVVLVSGKKEQHSAAIDCSAATQNMLLAAENLGLGSCWIGLVWYFFGEKGKIRGVKIPKGYEPLFCVTFGHKAGTQPKAPPRKPGTVDYID
ncbi:MAG: nitroreductase family protein [Elusimicrobiales bacterium]|nr:nitroreductase family protein [Elusimicrobiales bacterium]